MIDDSRLISVIIPVYNSEQYLIECIESIINNTYKNLEIIFIDDCSTDNSCEIINEFAQSDPRIILLKQLKNGGVSLARNIGIENANGEYICFIDSDDIIHPQYFEILLENVIKCNSDICICKFSRTNKHILETKINKNNITCEHLSIEGFFDNYSAKQIIWGRIFKKSILDYVRFDLHLKVLEDHLFNLSIHKNQKLNIYIINEELYFYRMASDSLSLKLNCLEMLPSLSLIDDEVNDSSNDFTFRQIALNEEIKHYLSAYYASSIELEKHKRPKKELNAYKKSILHNMKTISVKSSKLNIVYFWFIRLPFLYRLYRIIQDPTMLNWERNQKKLRKNI